MIQPGDKSERFNRDALIIQLTNAGAQFHGNSCKCIFHEDHHASAGVYVDAEGVWRFKCQRCEVGGDIFDMRARLAGTNLKNVLPFSAGNQETRTPPKPTGPAYATPEELAKHHKARVCATYRYGDSFAILREDPKGFSQIHRDPDGWRYGAIPKPWPIYRPEHLGETEEPTLVVEGEKCVEALWELGIVATTSAGGAGNGKHSDWTPLAGRDVVLWPDNDAEPFPGQKHMEEIGNILLALTPPPRVRLVDIKALDLPTKGDAVEFMARLTGKTDTEKRAAVVGVMQDATPLSAVRGLIELIEDAIAGRRKAIDLPWQGINDLALALLPSNIVILCGAPGCGKSFALLEVSHFLHRADVPVAIYMLEEETEYHLNRLWAQLEGNPNLLNPQWMKDHPDQTRAERDRHVEALELFAPVITAAPHKQPTLKELLAWAQEKAKAGCRVIIIDPISVAKMGREPWNEATEFMVDAKKIVRDSGASLIVSAHPKKGAQANGLVDLDSVAGGAGFTRLAQTVFWLEMHSDFHTGNIEGGYGRIDSCSFNRTMHVLKARNASGQGQKVALQFDRNKLRFHEIGIIVDKKKQPPKESVDGTYERSDEA
jgi:hypothetical protein